MTKKLISDVQEYLTVVSSEKCYKIVNNVELLMRRHPPDAVIAFLDQLRTEYKKELGKLLKHNKTDEKINELVAKNFRLKMAICTIRSAKRLRQSA